MGAVNFKGFSSGFECSLCGGEVTDEAFCLGCRGYICTGCDEGAPAGHTKPYQHSKLANELPEAA